MQNINHVVISGNLTRDPELRQTQGGSSVLSFGVAVNDSRRNPQTNQYEDYPNFVDVVAFGNRAESLSKILRKGMKVCIDGKLRYSSWEKDGQRRSKLEVIADNVELPPRQQNAPQNAPQPVPAPVPQPASQTQAYAQQYVPQPTAQPVVQQPDIYADELPWE